jgi:hypothetical protein
MADNEEFDRINYPFPSQKEALNSPTEAILFIEPPTLSL